MKIHNTFEKELLNGNLLIFSCHFHHEYGFWFYYLLIIHQYLLLPYHSQKKTMQI